MPSPGPLKDLGFHFFLSGNHQLHLIFLRLKHHRGEPLLVYFSLPFAHGRARFSSRKSGEQKPLRGSQQFT